MIMKGVDNMLEFEQYRLDLDAMKNDIDEMGASL